MNSEMFDGFMKSDIGQKLQKDSTDESLALRNMLIEKIGGLKIQLEDKALNENVAKLAQAKAQAELDLRAAKLAHDQAVTHQLGFITRTTREIKALEAELLEASPSFIRACMEKLVDRLSISQALNAEQSGTVRRIMKQVESWSFMGKSYDEMVGEFEKLQHDFEEALIKQGPIEIGRITY